MSLLSPRSSPHRPSTTRCRTVGPPGNPLRPRRPADAVRPRPSASRGARVELEGDVVGVAERYEVAGGAGDDVAVYDSMLIQPGHPRVESGPVRHREAQVVEPAAPFVERARYGGFTVTHEGHDH